MTMDFSKADNQRDFSELIPQGTLAWGILTIKAHNPDTGEWETPSKSSSGRYLRANIVIKGGPWDKRHVFININTKNDNVVAVEIGHGQIKAVLESSRGASPTNAQAYAIDSYGDLNGAAVAIKISEEYSEGYNPKNGVAVFLSPLQTEADWTRLVAGDTEPKGIQAVRKPASGGGTKGGAPAAQAPRWATGVGVSLPDSGAVGVPTDTPSGTPTTAPAAGAGVPPWMAAASKAPPVS